MIRILTTLFLILGIRFCFAIEVTVNGTYVSVNQGASNATTYSWNSVLIGNLQAQDGIFITTDRLKNQNDKTTELTVLFSFAATPIPVDAIITNITINVNRRLLSPDEAFVRDNKIQLTLGGNNVASTNFWPKSFGTATYSGDETYWGTTLTPSILNAGNFGMVISAIRTTNDGTSNMYPNLDYVGISVTYSTPLPIELISFNCLATDTNETVLRWETATETNTSLFYVERSENAADFEIIAHVQAAGTSFQKRSYSYTDQTPSNLRYYYRLISIDQDGSFEIHPLISRVFFKSKNSEPILYPNPASREINFRVKEENRSGQIQIYNLLNQLVFETNYTDSEITTLLVEKLPSGSYYLQNTNENGQLSTFWFIKD